MAVLDVDRAASLEDRVAEAALRCVARWGVAKTSLDDVAREAGVSRATVYRTFPGGKEALVAAVAAREVARFLDHLGEALGAAATLEDALVAGITESTLRIRHHDALQFLLTYEPGAVLPQVAFSHFDQVLAAAGAFTAPYLERWLPGEQARRAAEWAARIVLSYSTTPAAGVDAGDEGSVRRLVRTFVLPGLTTATAATAQQHQEGNH